MKNDNNVIIMLELLKNHILKRLKQSEFLTFYLGSSIVNANTVDDILLMIVDYFDEFYRKDIINIDFYNEYKNTFNKYGINETWFN